MANLDFLGGDWGLVEETGEHAIEPPQADAEHRDLDVRVAADSEGDWHKVTPARRKAAPRPNVPFAVLLRTG